MPTAAPGKNPVKYTYTHKSIAVGFCNVTCDWLVLLPLCSIFLADDDCSLSHIYTAIKSLFLPPPLPRPFSGSPITISPPPPDPKPANKSHHLFHYVVQYEEVGIAPELFPCSNKRRSAQNEIENISHCVLAMLCMWTYPIPLSWIRPMSSRAQSPEFGLSLDSFWLMLPPSWSLHSGVRQKIDRPEST